MKIVHFNHGVASCWNHGNAHFLRGLFDALHRMGHEVVSAEPAGAWSLAHLVEDAGAAPVVEFARRFPGIAIQTYRPGPDLPDRLAAIVAGADAVIVHEWTDAPVAGALTAMRDRSDGWPLLLHDTHHRALSEPDWIRRFDLPRLDGVLAFGDSLARLYRERYDARRVWTLHEAADVHRFRPLDRRTENDVVWIGNWGDDERADALRAYWLDAARTLPELRFVAHGTRYPAAALAEIEAAGVCFRGWAPSLETPELYARSRVTLHIPRRLYVETLSGIPTIRVFEALACGIPLVSAPWRDDEALFRPGDFVAADSPAAMRDAIATLARDDELRARQAERGLETVLARHTCEHRAEQLLDILATLGAAGAGTGAGGAADSLRLPV